MIPFEEIGQRLAALGLDRKWLQNASGRSSGAIRSALAPNANPIHRSELLQKALSDAIEREEMRRAAAPSTISGVYEIRQTAEEADLTDRASRAVNAPSLADFCLQAILYRAEQILHHDQDPVGFEIFSTKQRKVSPAVSDHPSTYLEVPEIPLFHAAAGAPILTDGDSYAPATDPGPGRIACRLHGDSMAPRYPDGSTVILRHKSSLKRPVLKKGETYLFNSGGQYTLKVWTSRPASAEEIALGITYTSGRDGLAKVRILRSLNPAVADLVIPADTDLDWIAWLDPKDNK